MKFDILTLFPDIIYSYSEASILGRGQKAGAIEIAAHNFRDWTLDKQRHVDDKPYGGGAGMVLQVQPIYDCLKSLGVLSGRLSLRGATERSDEAIPSLTRLSSGIRQNRGIASSSTDVRRRTPRNDKTKIIIMDPAGKKFDQRMAEKFSKLDRLVIISGRYEGFDERIYKFVDEKVSVGDYVLAGGELPALTIAEAVSRLIPGVLGNEESLREETFNKSEIQNKKSQINSKLNVQKSKISKEYPQYTRPENFMGIKVPKVLLSGDHKKIEDWRKKHCK